MSIKKRIMQAGAGLALAGAITAVNTQDVDAASWQANTVSEIKSVIDSQAVEQDGAVEYTFQNGDTLWGISQATGISVNKLAQVNSIENESMITVGNSIYLSENNSVVSVEENNQVKSYDVSEEVVTETETPEEVEEETSAEVIAPEEERNNEEPVQDQTEEDTQVEESEVEDSQEEDIQVEDTEEDIEEDTQDGSYEEDTEEEIYEEDTQDGSYEEDTEEEIYEEDTQDESYEEDTQEPVEEPGTLSSNNDENLGTPSSNSTSTQNTNPAPAPAPTSNVISIGESQLGRSYKWAGQSPSTGFDCSGFTSWVFAQAGNPIPRTTGGQMAAATPVSNPQVGDLVFFGSGGNVSHVGIYAGGGQFLGSQTSTGVAYASVHSGYWGQRFMGYGRI